MPRPQILVREDGPVTTVAFIGPRMLIDDGLVAVDDGAAWEANWSDPAAEVGLATGVLVDPYAPRPAPDAVPVAAARDLRDRHAALLRWARANVGPGRSRARRRAPPERDVRFAETTAAGEVRVEGWRRVARTSAHPFEALVAAIDRATAACLRAWGWAAEGLVVKIFPARHGAAMGLAYRPGDGDRLVGLNARLFEAFDLDSIERTLLHELCHHAREEIHPRTWSIATSHDARFCEMLAQVDPRVAGDPRACAYFTHAADVAAVAASSRAAGVAHDPDAGLLVVGPDPRTRRLRWRWEPHAAGAWRPRWRRLVTNELRPFLALFTDEDRPRLRVDAQGERMPLGSFLSVLRIAARDVAAFDAAYDGLLPGGIRRSAARRSAVRQNPARGTVGWIANPGKRPPHGANDCFRKKR